jgi:TPR repeat protein
MLRLSKGGLFVIAGAVAYAGGILRAAAASDVPLETQCQYTAASKYEADNKGVISPWDKIPGPHAEEVCRKAFEASQGSSTLKLRWARALIVNDKFEQGAAILDEAATNGDSVAMALLAEISRYGIKGSVDKKAAAVWLTRAAQHGNGVAKSDLGEMYYLGEGVEKNITTAVEWLNKAGDSRTSSGSALLGQLYFNGEGVPRDDARAVSLFKAAASENCFARFGLAVAQDGNRGGLNRGDQRKAVAQINLEAAYLWVARDKKCSDQLRQVAQTRANEIAYEGSAYFARSGSSRSGTLSFGEAFQQAVDIGIQTIAAVREGKKAGLITPEMEEIFEQIGANYNNNEARVRQQQEQACLNSGSRGRAAGGGCAR